MRNGIMLGNAAMLDGLIDRMTAELGEPATLIATGGMARFITPLCTHKITYDPDLLLRGLMILYRQNTETKGRVKLHCRMKLTFIRLFYSELSSRLLLSIHFV